MNGRMVFKHAITRMGEVSHEVLNKAGKTVNDLDLVLFHQANLRINQMVAEYLGVPEEKSGQHHHVDRQHHRGTIPICMHEAIRQNKLKENDLVLLTAFGSGFTWAASLLHW